jgi:5'(3')-deoxyribonucleotidase
MQIYDNIIVTDADGVLMYWEHGFHMWMLANGYKVLKTGFYDIEDMYGISSEKANMLTQAFNESAALKRLPPVKDSIKYVRKLHEEHGYVFHCISAIPNTQDMYEARMENIQNLFGKTAFERLVLCGSSTNKKELLKEYKDTDCFWIEDLTKNAEYGLEYNMRCILVNRHYNENDIVNPRIRRVDNWKEIYSLIEGSENHNWYK